MANNRPFKEYYGERVELQRDKRKLIRNTVDDILLYFDIVESNDKVVALEDILGDFYERLKEKEKEIEEYSKLQLV